MLQFWLESAFPSKLPPLKLKGFWAQVGQDTSHSSSLSHSLFSDPNPIMSARFPKRDSCSHLTSPDVEYNLNPRHRLSNPKPSWSSSFGAFWLFPLAPETPSFRHKLRLFCAAAACYHVRSFHIKRDPVYA